MTHRLIHTALGCICCLALLAGCADQQGMNTGGDPGAMQPPPRPAELDQLNAWAGQWTSTDEMTCGDGQKMSGTGTADCRWELDNRALISRCEGNMGEMGTMQCMIVYTYDAHAKKFKVNFFGSTGEATPGTLTYNSDKKTWHIKSEPSFDPMAGKMCVFEACVTMPDNNTMLWDMKSWESGIFGIKGKTVWEGTSTAKRKS